MVKFKSVEKREIVFEQEEYPTLFALLQKQKAFRKLEREREKERQELQAKEVEKEDETKKVL